MLIETLEQALAIARQSSARPDLSEGMAVIFEDNAMSKPVAITTAVFALAFCEKDPYYTWKIL